MTLPDMVKTALREAVADLDLTTLVRDAVHEAVAELLADNHRSL